MNPTNPTNPNPAWVRLAITTGFWCAVFTYSGFILDFVFDMIYSPTHIKFIGELTLVTCFAMLICGIALLKHRKVVGRTLIIFGIVTLFLWSLLMPKY
jgi:fluoride ion exporter CrcB/FEX